ncbi:MAG: HNH endonuclease family protein [Bifidobacteriaceae bacterium]|nr:HNH endonuclease family protein [Bifidobacteriaceae bacterium]
MLDHVVSLEDAWNSGGWRWPTNGREWRSFFNDVASLCPTAAWVDREKGGQNAAQWLPPSQAFHMRYVIEQIKIKAKYDLSVTRSEATTMRSILEQGL